MKKQFCGRGHEMRLTRRISGGKSFCGECHKMYDRRYRKAGLANLAQQRLRDRRKAGIAPTGSGAPKKTKCVNGHAYSDANTFTNTRGVKECRQCIRARDRLRYRKGSAQYERQLEHKRITYQKRKLS